MRSRSVVFKGARRLSVFLLFTLLLVGVSLLPATLAAGAEGDSEAAGPGVQADLDWGQMPLYFIANQGQLSEAVDFCVQGSDKTLYFTPEGLTFSLTGEQQSWTLKLDYLGAKAVAAQGEDQAEAVISYFSGSPDEWQTGLPTYSAVRYPGLWEGIDLVYSGTTDQLKQEFVLEPGADPDQIRLAYKGATITLGEAGELEVSTPVGGFTDAAPIAYQEVDGQRVEVPVSFALDEPSGSGAQETTAYGFELGDYDPTLPLVIDPAVMVYCGYIGGDDNDYIYDLVIDTSGNVYVTGHTKSTEATFPETVGPDQSHNGDWDVFVAKVNAAGTGLVYCGYIGGDNIDLAYGVALDSSGNAYVLGRTYSDESTFPVLGGPDTSHNSPGQYDVFVAKVNAGGTGLVYCGYIGGDATDYTEGGIAVDSSGNAYVTGYTVSTEGTFPVTVGPDTSHNGGWDAFVARVSADGSGLDYCGYIGGSLQDQGMDLEVDASGNAYVTGFAMSNQSTFPVVGGPDLTHNGSFDIFVAKLPPTGASLTYCGYIGGSGHDNGLGIELDPSGNVYVGGSTASSNMPVSGGLDSSFNGGSYDAYVLKVNSTGTALTYCGYIGGTGYDWVRDIAIDTSGNVYVTGHTDSSEASFPVANGPDSTYNSATDAFVAKVNAGGSALEYCGYIGGNGTDNGYGIEADASGNAYVGGFAASTEGTFPVTTGSLDETHNGGTYDAFVAKISPPVPPAVTGLSPSEGPVAGGTSVTITGTDLTGATSVTFGGTAASSYSVDSDTQITATSPAHAVGTVQVQVTTADGSSADTSADDFTYRDVPTVSSMNPTSGPTVGGTTVVITGTGYTGATSVTFGGTAATSYTVDSDTQITATSPAMAAGEYLVQITTAYGTNANISAAHYTYVAPPAVTGLSPTSGPIAGGTSVTITGTDLTGATAVTFGGDAASSYTVDSDTQITATSPAHAAGTVQVQVTTAYGTSSDVAADDFTFAAPPTVAGMSPTAGPTAGGTSVVIDGTNFVGVTGVTFGGTAASSYTVDSATQITAESPAHAAGTVQIQVTTNYGSSSDTPGDDFTYVAPPAVTGLDTTTGPTAGGTSVVITGTDFGALVGVSFGGTPAASYTLDSATQITATSPAHVADTVQIQVTTSYGSSSDVAADDFTYISPPTVTDITYDAGPVAGGDAVSITGTDFTDVTGVTFGGTAASSYSVYSDTQISATTPAHAAGTVQVQVTTAYGASSDVAADDYTYAEPPTITDITPAVGPETGGQTVVITGTSFFGVSELTFAGNTASSYTVDSPTQITATTPAHTPALVTVQVSAAGGTSDQEDNYSYTTTEAKRYQQSEGRMYYTGSWYTSKYYRYSGYTQKYTYKRGASVYIPFWGTQLDWITKTNSAMGYAYVSVDGADPKRVDLYTYRTKYKRMVWSTGELPYGLHWVKITCAGQASLGGYTAIGIDAVDVHGTLAWGTRYQEKAPELDYDGSWSPSWNWRYSGGRLTTARASGDEVTIRFDGVILNLNGTKARSFGKAWVSVDGGPRKLIDFYSYSAKYKTFLFSTGYLPPGEHTVTISWSGYKNYYSRGYAVNLDAIDVIGELLPASK